VHDWSSAACSEQTSVNTETQCHAGERRSKSHVTCMMRSHVGSMQHLSYMLVYFPTLVITRADIKTYWHGITLGHALACCIRGYVCQCYQMCKISGTKVVQKGTEVNLVVGPSDIEITLVSNRYVTKWPRGPEHDRYRTWPNSNPPPLVVMTSTATNYSLVEFA